MCVTAAAKILENIFKEDTSYSVSSLLSTLKGITAEEESTIRDAFQNPMKGELVTEVNPEETGADEDDDKIKIKTNLTKQDQPAAVGETEG